MAKRKKQRSKEETSSTGDKLPYLDYDAPHTYKRGWFGKGFRYFGAIIMLMLNISMTMSFITRLRHGYTMDPFKEVFFFLFLGIINLLFLIPLLFEANKVETTAESIRLHNLFWRRTLKWEQIESFEIPRFFKFSIIKTARCFYLINKYDLKPFDDLARTIVHKTSREDDSA